MSAKKYNNILDKFDEIAEKTQDDNVDSIAVWVRESVEKEHKPTMALVSFNLNHAERFHMVRQFFGIEIPKEIVQLVDGEPTCLILDYNETTALLNDYISGRRHILFGMPVETLKNYRIAICDEVQSDNEWFELSNEIDMACLIINATMAMNQMERTWLKECAVTFFEENELVLMISRMEQLNEDEDVDTVHKVIKDSLERIGVSLKVFENAKESLDWMIYSIKDISIQEKHDKRVVRNAVNVMDKRLKYLVDSVVISSITIQSSIGQLKKQQKSFELAGQLAAESIFYNDMNNLKIRLCDGIRDYGRQMAANIRKKIENSPFDQLEKMDDKINGYVSGSWEYYIKSMFEKTDMEMEAIAQKLTKQMETDAGVFVSELDESARRTVYNALGLTSIQIEAESPELIAPRSLIHGKNVFTEINVGTITDQLRKETRNMMLLSIPLLFVNPMISLGNIFVAKAYGKIKTESELEGIRSEMIKQIEGICFDNAESMVHQVESSFDEETRTGSINIKSAYNSIIHKLETSLNELNDSQAEKIALKSYLNDQITVVFPEFLNNLL